MKRIICLCLIALFALSLSTSPYVHATPFADANQAEIEYGRGVHAFYGGKYKDAVEILQGLEKQESKDPRVYYYLALSSLRQKQNKKAESYLDKAAELEFNGSSLRDYDIPETLRRIQGIERQKIETFREAALTKRQAEQKKQDEIKYSERRKTDSHIIESFTKPETKYDAAVLQELVKSSSASTVALQNPQEFPQELLSSDNRFGAKPIDPIHPSPEVKAVVPKKTLANKTAVAVDDAPTDLEPKNEEPADHSEEDSAETEKPKSVKKTSKAKTAEDEEENPFEQGRVKEKSKDDKEASEEDSADEKETPEQKSAGNEGVTLTNAAKLFGKRVSELLTKKSNEPNKETEDEKADDSEKENKPSAAKIKKETQSDDSEETDESENKEK